MIRNLHWGCVILLPWRVLINTVVTMTAKHKRESQSCACLTRHEFCLHAASVLKRQHGYRHTFQLLGLCGVGSHAVYFLRNRPLLPVYGWQTEDWWRVLAWGQRSLLRARCLLLDGQLHVCHHLVGSDWRKLHLRHWVHADQCVLRSGHAHRSLPLLTCVFPATITKRLRLLGATVRILDQADSIIGFYAPDGPLHGNCSLRTICGLVNSHRAGFCGIRAVGGVGVHFLFHHGRDEGRFDDWCVPICAHVHLCLCCDHHWHVQGWKRGWGSNQASDIEGRSVIITLSKSRNLLSLVSQDKQCSDSSFEESRFKSRKLWNCFSLKTQKSSNFLRELKVIGITQPTQSCIKEQIAFWL